MIENGRQVAIEYTLALEDGTTVDSNVGRSPLKYSHGSGEILPALEQALAGLKVNDTKHVVVAPEDGFGKVDSDAFHSVEPARLPDEARAVGTELIAEDESGNKRQIRVHEVHNDRVVLDFNHPLAGKTLHFDVRVIGIE